MYSILLSIFFTTFALASLTMELPPRTHNRSCFYPSAHDQKFICTKIETMNKHLSTLYLLAKTKENSLTLLDDIDRHCKGNTALKAYVLGTTWHTLASTHNEYYEMVSKLFLDLKDKAQTEDDTLGYETAIVLENYFRSGNHIFDSAIDYNFLNALTLLLALGKKPDTRTLSYAIKKNRPEAVSLLLQAGCPAEMPGAQLSNQPLVCALKSMNDRVVRLLIPYVDLTKKYPYSRPVDFESPYDISADEALQLTIEEYFAHEYKEETDESSASIHYGYVKKPQNPVYTTARLLLQKYAYLSKPTSMPAGNFLLLGPN